MDRIFEIREVDRRPPFSLASQVVLSAVLRGQYSTESVKKAQYAVDEVQSRWRKTLFRLRDANHPAIAAKTLHYLGNCPPFGFRSVEVAGRVCLPCRETRICPWCWGRRCAGFYIDTARAWNRHPETNLICWRMYRRAVCETPA